MRRRKRRRRGGGREQRRRRRKIFMCQIMLLISLGLGVEDDIGAHYKYLFKTVFWGCLGGLVG